MADRTPVAVLGTLAEFRRQPVPYDLAALVQLVSQVHPDLLCLDMTAEQWRRRDFKDLPGPSPSETVSRDRDTRVRAVIARKEKR